MISVPERILCLVAHPDDLEPQAGGTIIRFVEAGSEVHIIHAITPDIDRMGNQIADALNRRRSEARSASLALGATTTQFLDYQPNDFSHTQATVQVFDNEVAYFNPDLIISHHEVDTQQDHIVMAKIAETVCRRNRIALWQLSHSFPGGYLPQRPQPNMFVDITSIQEKKMTAISHYESQRKRYDGLLDGNWLEIIEARDRYYGGMLNQDGLSKTSYAEGFVVSKMVWKEKS